MTTKLFSLGSSKEGYEPLLEEDAIESFRMHDFSSKSYMDEFFPDQDYQLVAFPSVAPPEDESPRNNHIPYSMRPGILTPYQLKLEESALFPEFYFHFKRSFANISQENRAYCSVDLERFKSFYVGSEQDINSSVVRVEQDFDSKFKECLHPDLLNDFSSSIFTRAYVETKFLDSMKKNTDHFSYPNRMDELIHRARVCNENIMPFLDFLMAYEYPESSIWFQVILVYSRYFGTEKGKKFLSTKLEAWQGENAPLSRKVQGFAKDMHDELRSGAKKSFWTFCSIFLCILFAIFILVIILSK